MPSALRLPTSSIPIVYPSGNIHFKKFVKYRYTKPFFDAKYGLNLPGFGTFW
jgi:hypothetical protein